MTSIRKPVTWLALAQMGGVVYACLGAALTVKVADIAFSNLGSDFTRRIFREAYVMSHCGWLLLALPVVWFFAAVKYNEIQRDFFRGNIWIYLSGTALFLVSLYFAVLFTLGFLKAFT